MASLGSFKKGIVSTKGGLGQTGISTSTGAAPAPTYLLDFYTGAAAAYSVRRLSSSYSGSALRVRRSSDNAEQDIGFVGENLDTSALTTFVGANDGFVVTWYDQSGNGNHATQATAADQPQIVASGSTLLENGKPVIQPADGTDHLETTVDGSANTWNFSVIKFNVAAGIDALYNATGTNTSVLIADAGQTTPSINGATYSAVYADGSALATTTRDDIATATTNQALVTVSVNDSGLSNISLGYDLSTGVAMFNMQEFIYYTSDQSANRTAIESNINTYYTIYGNYDADAEAYFTAASITDTAEKDAVNQLVLDLKGTGSTTNNTDVWSSLDEIAPISTTSLAAAAYKLKYVNTQQITWANSPTHSVSGVAFNGSTQYGNFNYIPSTAGASTTSASIAVSVNGSGSGTEVFYGVIQATTQREAYFFSGAGSTICHLYQTGSTTGVSYTTIDRQGIFIASRRAVNDIEGYEDGVSQNTATGTASAGTLPSASTFIAANNDGTGTAANHANTIVSFISRGSGLTDNQAQDFYDAITKYNTALGR